MQRRAQHPVIRWMAATLDGMVEQTGAVFETKFMLPWSFSEEAAAEKYMPQLQHNTWVVNAKAALLSIITGGGKWVEITIPADSLVLTPDQSAILRKRLLGQLVAINSGDEAALWARQNLSAKNTLTANDARIVEEQFQTRLSIIGDGEDPSELSNAVSVRNVMPTASPDAGLAIAPSALWAKRFAYAIRSIESSSRGCLVCGRTPSDPHHLTFMQPRALGHRVSDKFTVPVCRVHHRELHRQGDEAAWWGKLSIDPVPVALNLWQHTRSKGDVITPSEGIAPLQAPQNLDISVQDRAGTNNDARADAESAVSKSRSNEPSSLLKLHRD